MQQIRPGRETEHSRDPGDETERPDPGPVEGAQGGEIGPRPLHQEGQSEQWQYGDGAHPDHEVQGVRGRRPPGQHIGDPPAGSGGDDEGEGEQRPRHALVDRGEPDPGQGHGHADDTEPPRAFGEDGGCQEGREDRLGLEDERGESRGHSGVHADEEQPELPHPQGQSDTNDPLPGDLRPADEEDGGDGRDEEAQCGEEQWREVVEPDVDDDEVHTPDGGDEYGEGDVYGAHVLRITG